METKRQQLNFWSKLAETTNFLPTLFLTVNTRSYMVIAVCALLLAFSVDARAAINSGRIYQLQQSLIENPKDTEAMLHLAMEYGLQNNFVKAVETYFALLRIDPDNFHAYNNLGILYKKSGQFRDSLHCYKQAERINPDSYWVPYNMGLCYEAMGRMQEARESYGRALSLNPGFTQALQRLRSLSDPDQNEVVPALPGLEESMVYLVDGQSQQPKIRDLRPVEPVKPKVETKQVPTEKPPEMPPKISEKLEKQKKEENKKVRTNRTGPAAVIFNQAMEALEKDQLEKAIELYASCIIAERDLLAEPENGLIRKGLEYLKDRPNRMTDGLFFRGFFIAISGNLELAVPDLRSFIEQNKNAGKDKQFFVEATRMVERYDAIIAEREALAKKQAEEQARAAELAREATPSEPEQPRASDFVIKRMGSEEVLAEADRLSRSGRQTDAIAVLKIGLEAEPDNLQMLMKSANAYTDLLLLKGDQEAGKMAMMQFEKIFSRAPEKSREWAVAQEMITELKKRLR
jgi:tetratricopeptide (TPR) repeat protein